jgi:hypothetical protein
MARLHLPRLPIAQSRRPAALPYDPYGHNMLRWKNTQLPQSPSNPGFTGSTLDFLPCPLTVGWLHSFYTCNGGPAHSISNGRQNSGSDGAGLFSFAMASKNASIFAAGLNTNKMLPSPSLV